MYCSCCPCCCPPNDNESDYGEGNVQESHIYRRQSTTDTLNDNASITSPLLRKRSVLVDALADQLLTRHKVQPEQYAPSTLNKALGLREGTYQSSKSSSATNSPRTQHRPLEHTPSDVPYNEPDYAVSSDKLGKLQFSLAYNENESTLTLKIIRAIELAAKDFSGTSDPYVKILLLPDKKTKLVTSIKRKNLNPRWNEVFAFEDFPLAKLTNRTLYMQVFDYDRFSRDEPIGEVCLPLNDLDFTSGHQTFWRSLQPCKGHAGKLGELLLSLCYQPSQSLVSLIVIKARQLKAKDITGLSDPYVKIWLMQDGKRVEKKKTPIIEKTLDPVYNEEFLFAMPYDKIRQTQLLVSVVDWDRIGRNETIGSILLGTKSGLLEVKHWNEMFAKPRQAVAQWHMLKDLG